MLPPAPGLFSTTTDWPQTCCRRLPTRRAVISVEPPGANGTTTRTGLVGQATARARDERMDGAATAAAAKPTKRRRFNMDTFPRCDRPIVSGHDAFSSVGEDPAKINSSVLRRKRPVAADLTRPPAFPHRPR